MSTGRYLMTLAALAGTLALSLALLAGPALATEGGGGAGGGGEGAGAGTTKLQLPDNPRDQVGLIFLAFTIVGTLLALDNARRRLKGEGQRASGEWRYR